MPTDLAFTGERFVPGIPGEIVYEHVHRYAFARRFARGRRVLDAACGEGYGSALLAQVAAQVTGVDLDAASVDHARARYAAANLSFVQASVTALPLPAGSVDLVVSFETLEHLPAADQPLMIAEFARVLSADGRLLISSPNRPEYSERRGHRNPFHLHELDGEELRALLAAAFPAQRWYRQRVWLGSMLRCESPGHAAEVLEGDASHVADAPSGDAMYFVVRASRNAEALPAGDPAVSLFADREQSEYARHDAQAREALRLDGLAGERLAALDRQTAHIEHLERLVAERDAEIARRGALLETTHRELGATQTQKTEAIGECDRLQRALDAQERIIEVRQGFRWWLALPWLRVKLAWSQWRGR